MGLPSGFQEYVPRPCPRVGLFQQSLFVGCQLNRENLVALGSGRFWGSPSAGAFPAVLVLFWHGRII
jgi:hypothetical protein